MTEAAFSRIYNEFLRPLFFRMRWPYNDFTKSDDATYDKAQTMMLLMDGHGSHIYDHTLLSQTLEDKVCKNVI